MSNLTKMADQAMIKRIGEVVQDYLRSQDYYEQDRREQWEHEQMMDQQREYEQTGYNEQWERENKQ
jgi:hypothetical protein